MRPRTRKLDTKSVVDIYKMRNKALDWLVGRI